MYKGDERESGYVVEWDRKGRHSTTSCCSSGVDSHKELVKIWSVEMSLMQSVYSV